ncbi:MAG: hypothetical protein A3K83_06655 [Omnitrophica WOR_2 bacterium RBG_13_44_8b]|nr:MAG: hypothetical protein A3K83_06655 [Omnitrophica WOR_2 bacterium RBG_13_44_8b]
MKNTNYYENGDTIFKALLKPAVFCFALLAIFSWTKQVALCQEQYITEENRSPEKISLDLKGIDIIELFRILSIKTGLTIVPHPGVKGRINLFLNNVRFEDVLDIILVTHSLAAERKGNIINIMTGDQYYYLYGKRFEEKRRVMTFKLNYAKPADVFNTLAQLKSDIGKIIVDESSATVVLLDIPEKLDLMQAMVRQIDLPPDTETFSLQYAKAKDLQAEVSKALSPGSGALLVDERTNKISIKDMPGRLSRIKRVVRAFDEQPSQVLIEAQVVELTLSDKFQRGIDWEKIFRGVNDLDFKGTFSLGLVDNRQDVSVGTLASDDYNIVLQLLQEYGRTNILSQPRIAAINNQEAKIMVGSREAYITQTLSSAESSTTTAESIQFIDVGVKLNVTPTISRDGFITMKIKPEVSSVREFITTKLGSRVPIVDTSEAETVVKVKDGAMVLIAGLTKRNETKQTKEVPFLARIPLLGMFFGNTTVGPAEPRYREFIVFLTPRIISGNVPEPREMISSDIVLKKKVKGYKE